MLRTPMLNSVGNKAKPQINTFMGLNRLDVIGDNEIADSLNLSSNFMPALGPRPSREVVNTLTDPQSLFAAGGKLAYVDGTDFYFDGVVKGTVTAGKKSMVDFNGYIVIYPDKKYYCYDSLNAEFDTFASFTSPDLDYVCEHDNRVFGVKDNDIRACKAGDFKSWEVFNVDELDSWAADVSSEGNFTGIAKYRGRVVFFKDDIQYELYGSIPSQFGYKEVSKIGCIDNDSIKEVNGRLFYLSRNGIYEYTGGIPRPISFKLSESYLGGSSGTDNRKYYISLFTNNGYKLYVYDTWLDMWYMEDNLEAIQFIDIDKIVYALSKDKNICKFDSGTERVNWKATTKEFDDNTFKKKATSKIRIRMYLEPQSTLNIYVKNDEGMWILEKSIAQSEQQSMKKRDITVTLRPRRNQRQQFRFEGSGLGKIFAIEREFSLGSDV